MARRSATQDRPWVALVAAGLCAAGLALGCIDPVQVGNVTGTCPAGTTCTCSVCQ